MYTLILVDYNSIEKTAAFAQQYAGCIVSQQTHHVVIVDNGTRQDTLDYLQNTFGQAQTLPDTVEGRTLYRLESGQIELIYCRFGENAGYARGNNLGMRVADAVFGDPYYIISNNDLILPQTLSLDAVTARFEKEPKMGILGPAVVDVCGQPQSPRKKQSAFTKLIAWYWGVGPLRKYVDDVYFDAPAGPCAWVMGCFFFVRREAFAAAGGFDENTFLYAEEMILSDRLRAQGYSTVYDPVFTVIHDHKETYKTVQGALRTIQISFDSNSYYYRTYRGTSPAVLLLSRWSFALYKLLYPLWQLTKKPKTDSAV